MKIFAGILLFCFLGAMGASLFHMSHGMDMTGSMGDCPKMAGEEVLCAKNLSDLFGTWKGVFASVSSPSYFVLVLSLVVIAISVLPKMRIQSTCNLLVLLRQFFFKRYTFSYRQFQELFSRGIIQPKVH